ncbi:MAG: hypothetical protein PHC45_03700 [Clostridiaceae bacterium]|nr:hypothetical protein [Clostridiaceae bacterium]
MDEELIGKIIRIKLNMAEKLVERLPEKTSAQIKDLGKIILKSINDNVSSPKEHSVEKGESTHMKHVPIE